MSAAILTFLAASCTNEELVKESEQLFTLSVENGTSSRTTLGSGYATLWSEGDQIYVSSDDGKVHGVLTLKNGAGTDRAEFEGFVSGNPNALDYSVFPVPTTNGVIDLSNRSADEIDAPMVGTITGGSTTLENKAAIIKLNIIDLPANSTLTISGDNIISSATWNGTEFVNGSAKEFVISGADASEDIFVPVFVKEGAYNTSLNIQVGEGNVLPLSNITLATNNVSVNVPTLLYANGSLNEASVMVGQTTGNGETIVDDNSIENSLKENDDATIIKISLSGNVTVDVRERLSDAIGGPSIQTVIIEGNGNTLTFNHNNSDWNNIALTNPEATLVLKNMHITNSGKNDGPWNRHDFFFNCNVEMENVTSDKAIALSKNATLTNVNICDTHPKNSEAYGLWIRPTGQTVNIVGGSIIAHESKTADRGITINDQYMKIEETGDVILNVDGTKFVTQKKGAIHVKFNSEVKEKGGVFANYKVNINLSGVDISGVKYDNVNAVTVDEDSAEKYDNIIVVGGSKVLEQ